MTTEKQKHLAMLARIQTQRINLDADQYAAVLDARLEGASWTEIGQALGLTKQAVQQRYTSRSGLGHLRPVGSFSGRACGVETGNGPCNRSAGHPGDHISKPDAPR